MRRLLALLAPILFFLLPFNGARADDSDFPEKPNHLVSDFTGTLSQEEAQSLENKLVAFDDSTSTQIAVVIIRSVGNYDISDYTVQLFNRWKIGQESKNNGILLLIAKDDRKIWITNGYGLEGVMTDAMTKRVIENEITPQFKAGDFYAGLNDGTTAIMQIVKGEYKADKKWNKNNGGFFPVIMFIFIFIIVMFLQVRRVSRYGKMNNLGFWAAWALLNAASRRSRGSWGGLSGGSGWGGGGWGSGGGGGGFGGFGGGSSGGGGAGGSW